MDIQLLEETLAGSGEPPFRARQVWEWMAKGIGGYAEMTNVPAALRERLERGVPLSSLRVRGELKARDGTMKTLFETTDGRPLETVLMRYRDRDSSSAGARGRRSICVSSQSGCPLTCGFCGTGLMQFARNLTVSEILDQALHFRRLEPVDHCVFMGMGEPMLNVDEVVAATRGLPDPRVPHP